MSVKTQFAIHKEGKHCASSPRYILDTVRHHEHETSSLFRYEMLLKYAYGLVLDLGCDCGGYTHAMMESNKVENVIGLDFLSWKLKRAKNPFSEPYCHSPTWKLADTWVCGEASCIPFQDKVFDTIVMTEIIEHVANPDDVIGEVKRCLKDNGLILLSTPLSFIKAKGHTHVFNANEVYLLINKYDMNVYEEFIKEFYGVKMLYLVIEK